MTGIAISRATLVSTELYRQLPSGCIADICGLWLIVVLLWLQRVSQLWLIINYNISVSLCLIMIELLCTEVDKVCFFSSFNGLPPHHS